MPAISESSLKIPAQSENDYPLMVVVGGTVAIGSVVAQCIWKELVEDTFPSGTSLLLFKTVTIVFPGVVAGVGIVGIIGCLWMNRSRTGQ